MKVLKLTLLSLVFCLQIANVNSTFAQCLPLVIIDGNYNVADENNVKGIKLPLWLKAGQTIAQGQFVYSISVIEFTVNGTSLDYSQNLSVTTVQTVPAGKTWKIESILKDMAMPSSGTGVTYSNPGVYTFTSPSCITVAYIQVWGAGGGGANGYSSTGGGSGGGAGGYSEGTYQLAASTNYTITVGTGGAGGSSNGASGSAGGTSSVGTIGLSSTGGAAGIGSGGAGGAAGSGSGGQLNLSGQAGFTYSGNIGGNGGSAPYSGGIGGAGGPSAGAGAANGGSGGFGAGGGGGGYYVGGGKGGDGKVVVSFGNSGSNSSTVLTPKVPCVVMYLRRYTGAGEPSACPSGWTQVDYQTEYNGNSTNYVRTCVRCD